MKFEEETGRHSSSGAAAPDVDSEQILTDASILSAFIAHNVSRHFISLSKQAQALHEGNIKPGMCLSGPFWENTLNENLK